MTNHNAFEGFKFNIGDLVTLVTSRAERDAMCGMILERLLVEDTLGQRRAYLVSSSESCGLRSEVELMHWPDVV